MGSEEPKQFGASVPVDVRQQCVVRDANEATEVLNVALDASAARSDLRCECGDLACASQLDLSHLEYEAVRASGSQFLIAVNHENPESAWVLSENTRFAVIDVVVAEMRYAVLARNPRHAWVDAQVRSTS